MEIPELGVGKFRGKNQTKIHTFVSFYTIYSMILPIFMMDLLIFYYQTFYFGTTQIPKIKRSDYIVFDRSKLSKLNFIQKISCVYCEYTNGLVELAKAVANQTEAYNCAIKHNVKAKGQDHQKEFFEYKDFL